MTSKSLTASPSGTPWSGHPMKWIWVMFWGLPSGFKAYSSLFSTISFVERKSFYNNLTFVLSCYVLDCVISNYISSFTFWGQNWLHLARPYSFVRHVLTIMVTFCSKTICQKWSVVAGSGP